MMQLLYQADALAVRFLDWCATDDDAAFQFILGTACVSLVWLVLATLRSEAEWR